MNSSEAYSILGVSNSASIKELKRAYKRLAKKHHPDVGGDVKKFHSIKEAFDILTHVDADGIHFNMDNIFNTLFKGARPFKQYAKQKIRLPEMSITLQQAYQGGRVEKRIEVQVPCDTCGGLGRTGDECPHCKGMGYQQHIRKAHFMNTDICGYCIGTGFTEKCSDCDGKGLKTQTDTVAVNIPPLLPDGAILPNMNPGLHRRVQIRISVPSDYKLFPGKILYTPEVDILDILKGYTIDVLGIAVDIPAFTFRDIGVDDNIIIRPRIQVKDKKIFDDLLK